MALPASLLSSCSNVDRGTSTVLDVARAAPALRCRCLLKRGTRVGGGGREAAGRKDSLITSSDVQAGCKSSGRACFLRSWPCFSQCQRGMGLSLDWLKGYAPVPVRSGSLSTLFIGGAASLRTRIEMEGVRFTCGVASTGGPGRTASPTWVNVFKYSSERQKYG